MKTNAKPPWKSFLFLKFDDFLCTQSPASLKLRASEKHPGPIIPQIKFINPDVAL